MLTRGIRPVHEQAWITLAFVLLGVLLAWEFAGRILSDDLVFLEAIALAVVGCVGVASILRNWRLGFCFFNVWLLFEDLFRKYMGNSTALFSGRTFWPSFYTGVFCSPSRGARREGSVRHSYCGFP